MFAAQVVEAVDVFEECKLDLTPGMPVAVPDQFGLERLEEAFDRCLAGDLQRKSAERGRNCRNNCPCRSSRASARICAEASDSHGRSIASRGPCGECSLAVAFGSPLSRM